MQPRQSHRSKGPSSYFVHHFQVVCHFHPAGWSFCLCLSVQLGTHLRIENKSGGNRTRKEKFLKESQKKNFLNHLSFRFTGQKQLPAESWSCISHYWMFLGNTQMKKLESHFDWKHFISFFSTCLRIES